MAHRIQEDDATPNPSTPPSLRAEAVQSEYDRLQVLWRRLETAAEALARVRDQLQARAPGYRGWEEAGHPNPDGGRQ
jgi:hypothetical protein